MITKTTLVNLLLICMLLSACGQEASLADKFTEYNSTPYLDEHPTLSTRIPVFTVKYPPDWNHGWVADSGIIALFFASGDLETAFRGRDDEGAFVMVVPWNIPAEYTGKKPGEMFYTTLELHVPLEPSETTPINGQDAALVEYSHDNETTIEAVVVRGDWALLVVARFPSDKDADLRPSIDAMISTLQIQ